MNFKHCQTVGESYTRHMRFASGMGFTMLAGGVAALVHSVLPFMFVKTASDVIHNLNRKLILR